MHQRQAGVTVMGNPTVALCMVLSVMLASAVALPNTEAGTPARALLQLYTEEELQQELQLIKQHLAELQLVQLFGSKGAAAGLHAVTTAEHAAAPAAEPAATDSHGSSGYVPGLAAGEEPAEDGSFMFDVSQDQQAPPVNLSQRRADLLSLLSRIAEIDPDLFGLASSPGSNESNSSRNDYQLESAQMLGPGYSHLLAEDMFVGSDDADSAESQFQALFTKLIGRGPKLGTKERQFIPRTESTPLTANEYQASTEQKNSGPAALFEQLSSDPGIANEKLKTLLSRVNGISGSIVKTAADKTFIPRSAAAPLAPGGGELTNADDQLLSEPAPGGKGETDASSGEVEDVAVLDTSGKGPYFGSTSVTPASGEPQLADPTEIHVDSSLRANTLQPVTPAASVQQAMSFQEMQKTAADVANAAASMNSDVFVDSDGAAVIIPFSNADDTASDEPNINAAAPHRKGLGAAAVTGIAVGTFIAILFGAGILLICQARQIQQEVDSGYTKTAQNDDVESASKPPTVCVSPAVSMGGALTSPGGGKQSNGGANQSVGGAKKSTGGAKQSTGGVKQSTGGAKQSTGGAKQSTGGASSQQERSTKTNTGGGHPVQEPFTPLQSGTGYLRVLRAPTSGAGSVAPVTTNTSSSTSSWGVQSLD